MSTLVAAWGLGIKMVVNLTCAGLFAAELKLPQATIFAGLVVADLGMVFVLWRAH